MQIYIYIYICVLVCCPLLSLKNTSSITARTQGRFGFQLLAKGLELWLPHSRCSTGVCWMDTWYHYSNYGTLRRDSVSDP